MEAGLVTPCGQTRQSFAQGSAVLLVVFVHADLNDAD